MHGLEQRLAEQARTVEAKERGIQAMREQLAVIKERLTAGGGVSVFDGMGM